MKEFVFTQEFESRDRFDLGTWKEFRVGTCTGLWRHSFENDGIDILAVVNRKRGNGHFKQAMMYFERACRRGGTTLRVWEVWNIWFAYKLWRFGYKLKSLWHFRWEKDFAKL